MSELAYADTVVTSAPTAPSKENIAARRIIVYQTLIDPTLARIEGEKIKNKLFNRYLFKLNSPDEIEFASIEKYYEPYIVVSGKHFIDYYRKCAYDVRVDKEAKEVILFDQTFIPKQPSYTATSESRIRLEGEERIVRERSTFIVLNRYGQDSKLSDFPTGQSEKNPRELIKSFNMLEMPPNVDVDLIRKRIAQHPNDIHRIVNEVLEIDDRSVVYSPRFRIIYKCPSIGKEAYLEFDGVTLKRIQQDETVLSMATNAITSTLKRLFSIVKNG